MKKLLITFLAVFYLSVSAGASVHFHYCMGQLIEWGLSQNTPDKAGNCSNCGMKKAALEDCCKHQQQELKALDSQKAPENAYQAKIFVLQALSFSDFKIAALPITSELYPLNNAPPRTAKTAVFIHNCNFRI